LNRKADGSHGGAGMSENVVDSLAFLAAERLSCRAAKPCQLGRSRLPPTVGWPFRAATGLLNDCERFDAGGAQDSGAGAGAGCKRVAQQSFGVGVVVGALPTVGEVEQGETKQPVIPGLPCEIDTLAVPSLGVVVLSVMDRDAPQGDAGSGLGP
jgi:hypothetical protein